MLFAQVASVHRGKIQVAAGARFVATPKPKMRTGSQFWVHDPFHSAARELKCFRSVRRFFWRMTVWTGGNLVAVGCDWNPTVAVAVGFQYHCLLSPTHVLFFQCLSDMLCHFSCKARCSLGSFWGISVPLTGVFVAFAMLKLLGHTYLTSSSPLVLVEQALLTTQMFIWRLPTAEQKCKIS